MINPIFLLDHFDYIHTLICATAIPGKVPLDDPHKDHGRAEAVADEGDPGGGRNSLIPRKTSATEEHPAENGLKNKRCYYKSIVLK